MREFGPGRKQRDVRAHEHPGLLFGVVLIISVVIPVEIGFGGNSKEFEELLFALRQGVESRHYIPPRFGKGERAFGDAVGGGPLDQRIGQRRFSPSQFVATRPYVGHGRKVGGLAAIPLHGLFHRAGRELREVFSPVLGQNLQLGGRQVGDVGFDLLDFGDVAEEHLRVDQVFVDRIEVREEHIAPEIELVEGFVVVGRVDFVKLGDEPHAVARMQPRYFARQVVDRHPFGLPHRTPGDTPQGIDEKQPRTPRRKEQRTVGQPLAVAFVKVPGDFVEKSQDYEF